MTRSRGGKNQEQQGGAAIREAAFLLGGLDSGPCSNKHLLCQCVLEQDTEVPPRFLSTMWLSSDCTVEMDAFFCVRLS